MYIIYYIIRYIIYYIIIFLMTWTNKAIRDTSSVRLLSIDLRHSRNKRLIYLQKESNYFISVIAFLPSTYLYIPIIYISYFIYYYTLAIIIAFFFDVRVLPLCKINCLYTDENIVLLILLLLRRTRDKRESVYVCVWEEWELTIFVFFFYSIHLCI